VSHHRRRVLASALCVVATLAAGAVLAAPAQAGVPCKATFQVLHNDRIGTMQLPKGTYQIRVDGISCSSASSLFSAFLNDYDGILPGGWRATPRGRGQGLFVRGGDTFAVELQSSGGGGGGLACSQPFEVTQPTQAGLLPLPAGSYQLVRLSTLSPTCAQASALLTSFLGLTSQVLPGGWVSLPLDGAFVQDSLTVGFRVKPLA
jgi:hypothetical protein